MEKMNFVREGRGKIWAELEGRLTRHHEMRGDGSDNLFATSGSSEDDVREED